MVEKTKALCKRFDIPMKAAVLYFVDLLRTTHLQK